MGLRISLKMLRVDTNRVFVVRFMNVVQNMAGKTGQIGMVVYYVPDMLLKSCEGKYFCLAHLPI
jgi:acetolactate synthase regulatory subunit